MYYSVFGVWAIIDIKSFSAFTHYQGDFFLKHTAAVLFTGLGVYFLLSSLYKHISIEVLGIGSGVALAMVVVDYYYVPKIGNPWPFWYDLLVEGTLGFILLLGFLYSAGKN